MDLTYSPAHERFREKVKAFLKGWPLQGAEAKLPLAEQEALFRRRGVDAGLVYRNVPKRFGGSEQAPDRAPRTRSSRRSFAAAGAPMDLTTQRRRHADAGPDAARVAEPRSGRRRSYVAPATLMGEESLVSGLQRAGLGQRSRERCRPGRELVGDEWVLKGQKIWTSSAPMRADLMFCLVRTEPGAKKHEGISYLLDRR
jgi:alkylation response protein AidB-like acyl-CoA dehydrogenase